MDYTDMFKKLWDLVIGLIETIDKVWEWISKSHTLGIKIAALNLDLSITINPLQLTGAVMVTLIIALIIKTFIPVA